MRTPFEIVLESFPHFARTLIEELDRGGYVLVPKEPTPEMIEAGMDADTREWRIKLGRLPTIEEAQANDYAAMIEARPK